MSAVERIAVWGFRWVPPFAQGLVRDLRVRWALEEAGRAYQSRLVGIEERNSDVYRRKHPFGIVPVLDIGGETVIESGAVVHSMAENCEALMPADKAHGAAFTTLLIMPFNKFEVVEGQTLHSSY